MKSFRSIPVWASGSALALACALAACAIPATQVEVPTRSMREALEQVRSTRPPALLNAAGTAIAANGSNALTDEARAALRTTLPPGVPKPLIATPDVRMAYLYEWIDREGNQHFGTWVAIALTGFDWILNKGPAAPMPALIDLPEPSAPPDADVPSTTPSSAAPTR
jgi:hypothetical protein